MADQSIVEHVWMKQKKRKQKHLQSLKDALATATTQPKTFTESLLCVLKNHVGHTHLHTLAHSLTHLPCVLFIKSNWFYFCAVLGLPLIKVYIIIAPHIHFIVSIYWFFKRFSITLMCLTRLFRWMCVVHNSQTRNSIVYFFLVIYSIILHEFTEFSFNVLSFHEN